MINGKVSGVRSIELGVRDLQQSADFYTKVWALEEVGSDADSIHLRATGGEHHVLTIRERPKSSLLAVNFAAQDRASVDQLCAKAKSYGIKVLSEPAPLPGAAGGGYGFRFESPEGFTMTISSDSAQHPNTMLDRSRPSKISHVVLNSGSTAEQMKFFIDVLGFKHSDSTHMMDFLRCSADHHSIAMFRANGPSLNHVAYEMPNMDGLMRGAGRLKKNGFETGWGVGRHGPGNNVFSYFIEPDGFVAEYTTSSIRSMKRRSYRRMRPIGTRSCSSRATAGAQPACPRTSCGSRCRAGSILANSRRRACAAKTLSAASSAANRG